MTAPGRYVRAPESPRSCAACGVALEHDVHIAGRRFTLADNPRKRYCAPRCKQAAYRDRLDAKDAWYGLPPGSSRRWLSERESQRRRSARTFARRGDQLYCPCGRKLMGRKDQLYCSQACRQRAYRSREGVPVTDLQLVEEAAP